MFIKLLTVLLIIYSCSCENDYDDVICGKRKVLRTGLVKGGYSSKPGDWPWHTGIYHKIDGQFDYQCGGTLIHKYLVLTAAHCVVEFGLRRTLPVDRILVKLGKYNLEVLENNSEDYNVSEIITHREYNQNTFENDIALLKLQVPVIFTNYIQPACIWKRDDGIVLPNIIGLNGSVIGWGLTDKNKVSDVLVEAKMPVVDSFNCLKSNKDFFGQFLYSKAYCAGFRNGTSVCQGDSGGGMFFQTKNQWYLRGIVSFSNTEANTGRCALQDYVGFTDSSQYLQWIYENTPVKNNVDPILGHPNLRLINSHECGYNEYPLGFNESDKPTIARYPWMVTLRHPFAAVTYVACSGALINQNYVLTTTCINLDGEILATMGEYDTHQTKDVQVFKNETYESSPVYSANVESFVMKDKVVLLRLSSPAPIGRRDHIKSICLPTTKTLRSRKWRKYILTGWKESGRDANVMQRFEVSAVDTNKCISEFAQENYLQDDEKNITDAQICIRNNRHPNRSPRCDDFLHGTAIQSFGNVNGKNNSYILNGFLTRISYCSLPDLYVNIAPYLEWILDNLRP